MSKPSGKKKGHQRQKFRGDRLAQSRTSDTSRYIVFVMIGLFVTAFGWVFAGDHWREFAFGYVIVLAFMINMNAIHAYRGDKIAPWQQALARLPLRCVGYGTKHGKPLEGAHNSGKALKMIWVSLVVSLVVLAGLFVWLFGERVW